MNKKFLSVLITSLLLSSCFTEKNTLDNNNISQVSNFTKKASNLETLVDKKNLETNLAILSGKTAFQNAPIPERGTTEGRNLTRTFIKSYLTSLGYNVETQKYRTNGENILVKLMATTPTNEYVLLGAHLDSVRNSGANDNGTGTTAVLEVARILKELETRKVNIIFAWFDEEEIGLVGSEAMAKEFKKQKLNLTSAHTIDMMGWDGDKDRVIEIEQPDGMLWDYYNQVNKSHNLNFKLSRTSGGSTDHEAFRAEGFNSVGLCEEWTAKDTTPYYHKKTDTYETVDFGILENATKLLVSIFTDLSQKTVLKNPSPFIPHNKFPGRPRHFHKFE
jgi:aminopeptidase-like protein